MHSMEVWDASTGVLWWCRECMNLESKLQVMQQRRDRAAGSLQNEAARRAQADLANQLLSLQEVRRSSRQCPRCSIAIEKTFGCNKMTCTNCSALFCYR
jgi:E3 ubiquitin-protein ligase RNF14